MHIEVPVTAGARLQTFDKVEIGKRDVRVIRVKGVFQNENESDRVELGEKEEENEKKRNNWMTDGDDD